LIGLVSAPLVILVIAFGQKIGLLLLILAASSQGLNEFYKLILPEIRRQEKIAGIGLGLFFPLAAYFGQVEVILAATVLAVFLLFLFFTVKPETSGTNMSHMAGMLLGVIFVSFLLSHILLLRNQTWGVRWVLFLVMTVWAGDTCAYFVGTLIGKHKLYPKISPKKTVEGLLGGLGGSILMAFFFQRFVLKSIGWSHLVILSVFILIFGQIGDFSESMIKRSANVKDSSRLIPGHGGLLDRLDSFLFSTPFVYYYVWVITR
jgi:phosphatidate cytidylyltransferase